MLCIATGAAKVPFSDGLRPPSPGEPASYENLLCAFLICRRDALHRDRRRQGAILGQPAAAIARYLRPFYG